MPAREHGMICSKMQYYAEGYLVYLVWLQKLILCCLDCGIKFKGQINIILKIHQSPSLVL